MGATVCDIDELAAEAIGTLNYDENDGLFDHVPPPTPPAGTPDEFVTATDPVSRVPGSGLPIGLGFRVPCIIISPWTQGGWVCSDVSDHTSCLKFCEVVTGVPATNISAWRRQTVSDFAGAFNARGMTPRRPSSPTPPASSSWPTTRRRCRCRRSRAPIRSSPSSPAATAGTPAD